MNRIWNHYAGGMLAIAILLSCVWVASVVFVPTGAHAGLRCQYIVEKTQSNRGIQQANLNSAASAGYKLAQQTAAQTVLVKCS
jgi:hypothetical protein